jgi:glutathione reductase (NADPH)
MDKSGNVVVDDFQNTSANNVYAVGDVIGKALLTPGSMRLA